MNRKQVNSSTIKSVGYVAAEQLLEIEFRSGGIYQYRDVPGGVVAEMLLAPSPGHAFHTLIRDKYPTVQVHPNGQHGGQSSPNVPAQGTSLKEPNNGE